MKPTDDAPESELIRLMLAHGAALGIASTSAVFDMVWRTIPTLKALVALANKHPDDFAAALERARAAPMPFTHPPMAAPPAPASAKGERIWRAQLKRHGAVTAWRRGGGYAIQTPQLLVAAGEWLIVSDARSAGAVMAELRGEDGSTWWESLHPDPEPKDGDDAGSA